jgi:Domain of unknown function (DUF4129)
MHKFILISVLTLVFFTAATAQEKKYLYQDSTLAEAEELYDTSAIKVQAPVEEVVDNMIYEEKADDGENIIDTSLYFNQLVISPDSVTAWKGLQAFSYIKNLDSLLKAEKGKKKKEEKEEDYTSTPSGGGWLNSILSSGGLQAFLWVLAALFVLFILYKLFLTEGAFRKKTAASKSATPDVEEEVITAESDFDVLIKQAAQSGNYRLAVRYQYLQTLHKLADKKLIELAADKTNYQYVREITQPDFQNDFAALTLNYEYVWYGEFAIDENIYRNMSAGFSKFNTKV